MVASSWPARIIATITSQSGSDRRPTGFVDDLPTHLRGEAEAVEVDVGVMVSGNATAVGAHHVGRAEQRERPLGSRAGGRSSGVTIHWVRAAVSVAARDHHVPACQHIERLARPLP
jgi:hypothetical protein